MDFMKNLSSHFQNLSDAETIPETKMAQNSGIENTVVHRDIDLDSLLTSQSSGEISDIFTNEFNSKNTDVRGPSQNYSEDLQDIREVIDGENVKTNYVSNSSPESICIDFGGDTPPKNVEIYEPDTLLNLNNFEKNFYEINKVGECESTEINALEEPLFFSFDDVDKENGNNLDEGFNVNENVTLENYKNPLLGVNDGKLNIKMESELFLDEYQGIFKYLDNNGPERVDAVEKQASTGINGKTIENSENIISDVPIDFNITLTPIEIEHDYTSLNTKTNEMKLENIFINDFEADLEKNVISKNGVIQTVMETQPMLQIEKANNNYMSLTNEKDTLFELKDDKASSIIAIHSSKTNSKSSKVTENDTISVICPENVPNGKVYNDSDDCSGYNSTDFEFISEDEAQEGLIIDCYNKKLTTPQRSNTVHTLEISKDKRYASGSSEYSSGLANSSGPSNPRSQPNVYYNPGDTNYRQNHRIPDEQEYLNLFQIFAPLEMFFLENKSANCMNVPPKQVCLDVVGDSNDDSDYEFKDEAEESTKKIRLMYPGENREGRRRF